MEPMQIPDGMDFSEDNFRCNWFSPTDDMPLMPMYNTYESRLHSFRKMKNPCDKEVKILAMTGFYFPNETVKVPNILPNVEIDEMTFKNAEERFIALCFCCGNDIIIFSTYPLVKPVQHFLHCKFFVLPEDKKHIKLSIKPYEGRREDAFKHLDELRKLIYPERNYPPASINDIPKCSSCSPNEIEVRCYPCKHFCCIKCAKSLLVCPVCGEKYEGLKRIRYF